MALAMALPEFQFHMRGQLENAVLRHCPTGAAILLSWPSRRKRFMCIARQELIDHHHVPLEKAVHVHSPAEAH
jgi:hypothetical protein